MLTAQAALAAISTAALVYGAASLVIADIKCTARKVGGITFIRLGRHQISYCRPRPAPVISAARLAMVTKRAQSRQAQRLDTLARQWVVEGR